MQWYGEELMSCADKIILNNMKFFGYHGVLPEEQEKGQNFFIDVEMFTNTKRAGLSDNLEETIHYGEVFEIIEEITINKKFRLIERLAEVISLEILSRYEKIDKIIVRVRKPDAPIKGDFDWAGVEIERDRNDL
jgi:7,8-dihydroneopterin aldolase/epimerase/oxygenase